MIKTALEKEIHDDKELQKHITFVSNYFKENGVKNHFIVADRGDGKPGHSKTSNNGNQVIKSLRDKLIEIEKNRGEDPNHSWSEKIAGGPGSGVEYKNTKKINMPVSEHVSVGTRSGMLNVMPFVEKKIPLNKITKVSQYKYVPEKLKRMQKDWDKIKDIPIDVLEIDGKYHVVDGHHRFLLHKQNGSEYINARVYHHRDSKNHPDNTKAPVIVLDRDKKRQLVEHLSDLKHEEWMDLAGGVMATEDISDKRRKRWTKYMTPYKELNEFNKDKDRNLARNVIDVLLGEPVKEIAKEDFPFNKKNMEKKAEQTTCSSQGITHRYLSPFSTKYLNDRKKAVNDFRTALPKPKNISSKSIVIKKPEEGIKLLEIKPENENFN